MSALQSLRQGLDAQRLARRAGAEQAIDMLVEVQQLASFAIEADRDPQDVSVVVRYLTELNPEQLEGFATVLTDFLGSSMDGAVPDIGLYERFIEEGRI